MKINGVSSNNQPIKKGESKEIKDPAVLKALMGRDLIPFFEDTHNNNTHNNTHNNNTHNNNNTDEQELPNHKAWAGFCSPPHHKDIPFPISFIRHSSES